MWERKMIETTRGTFEYFTCGNGEPLAITHFYSAFTEKGNWFANPFTKHYQVFLINVRGAGNSPEIIFDEELKLHNVILDLEAIREALFFEKWTFAGHSTGGMLALQYAVDKQQSLTSIICGCSAASKLSMVYVGEFPMLTITGILGLSGVSFFVYRIVSRWIH